MESLLTLPLAKRVVKSPINSASLKRLLAQASLSLSIAGANRKRQHD